MREKPMSNLDVNEIARSVQQRTLHVEAVSEVVHGRGRDSAEEKRDEVAGHAEQRRIHLSVEEVGEVEEGREAECEQEIDSEVEKTRGNGGVEKH